MKDEKKKDLFKEYLATGELLIVDKSTSSRSRLTKTLVDMGAKRNQIQSVGHFNEALEIIKSKKPKLVLSDYMLSGGSGFDLFKEYRLIYPKEKNSVLILVTSNISQSSVAKAAEEDVDSFIIKPYTVQSLEKSLINTVISKLYPSEYVQEIEKGKEKLFAGNYQEAIEIFNNAVTLSKKPSLALFYHGQAKYMMQAFEDAEKDYQQGLTVNNIHFKCQIGLYELFMKDKRYKEAYDVVKNISKYFPANPERLKEVVRLAMITQNYGDMDLYYEIFTQLDERPQDVINYICSGMFIAGKYFMQSKNANKARELFDQVGISCAGIPKFLLAMIKTLVNYNFYEDAQKLVGRFSGNNEDKNAYMLAKFLANSDKTPTKELISAALEMWNNGNKDPDATKILIAALKRDGADKKAQQYLDEAKYLWPNDFENMIVNSYAA